MVCTERDFIDLSGVHSALQEAWGTVMTALSSECAQGVAMTMLGTASLVVAVTGVEELAGAGGIVIISASSAATSGAAAYYVAGPENVWNVITYLPRGIYQMVTSCR